MEGFRQRSPWLQVLVFIGLAWMLTGCAGLRLEQFSGRTPELKIEEFLLGPSTAHGMVQGPGGQLARRFVAELHGHREGELLVLDERFVFDDGEVQTRIWRIESLGNGRYRGTAGDVVGEAVGEAVGPALRWPFNGGTLDLAVDDWLIQSDARVLLNRSQLRKFGVPVGEVTLTIIRSPEAMGQTP